MEVSTNYVKLEDSLYSIAAHDLMHAIFYATAAYQDEDHVYLSIKAFERFSDHDCTMDVYMPNREDPGFT